MLTYQCKKCRFSFSQADKDWDRAIIDGSCPECGEKLENFHLSEKEIEHVKKNLKEIDLLNADKSLAESLTFMGWTCILSLFCILFVLLNFVLFNVGKASNNLGTGSGKIIGAGIVGLALIINFYRKRHKRRAIFSKNNK